MGKNTTHVRQKGEVVCPHCGHNGAWSRWDGTFCSRCKKDINEKPDLPKPIRGKGVHPKANYKKKINKEKAE